MKRFLGSLILNATLALAAFSQSSRDRAVGEGCDECKLMYEGMPAQLSWETTIAGPDEPGEPMLISGRIFKKGGHTPAPGVILYVYHTDSKGLYSVEPEQSAGKRHGHLRGWIKTGADGWYQFKSIRPTSYPKSTNPAHIHPLIKEPGLTLYWIDEYLFDDDPFVTDKVRLEQQRRGGPGIIHLSKNEKGVWIGRRNIILGMNIPNY